MEIGPACLNYLGDRRGRACRRPHVGKGVTSNFVHIALDPGSRKSKLQIEGTP